MSSLVCAHPVDGRIVVVDDRLPTAMTRNADGCWSPGGPSGFELLEYYVSVTGPAAEAHVADALAAVGDRRKVAA